MQTKKQVHKWACMALFIAAILWASSVVALKDSLENLSPVWILALRFVMATGILSIILAPKLKQMTKETLKGGSLMGIILYFEFWFFTAGLKETTSSKATFILAAYIIILPLIYWIVRKKKPQAKEVLASIICALGLALILLGDFGGISRGDVICLGSATCYALHIVYTGILAKENDPALLNLVQIGTGGVIGIVIALLTEPIPAGIQTGDFLNMGYLAVFCTILPYMLSVFGQKHVKTSTSGIILSFESVFGCVFSVVFLGEELSPRFFLGAILVMCSFLVVEYGWKPVLRPVFMRKQECE